ncbi:MAG: hypothetical protein GWO20_17710 [Candidatus Korarchaeota archaeon]|nr:hypothetical protein [Candidatus Korarchaeota archaeon]NIU83819.1 hypothetical protein [Candidatus Thorarchaeota archaeon]NIW15233.1 hypothetical protein [Candidatus Thorarchaeota archaeon]NIW53210.1 hypothetical protein [Candidatus Korarchaeota archaeon]
MSKRWLLFELLGRDEPIEKKQLALAIKRVLYKTLGTFANLKLSFWIHELERNRGILEVNQKGLTLLRTNFTLMDSIEGKEVLIIDLLVSGTLKSLKEKRNNVTFWTEARKKLKQEISSVEGIIEEDGMRFFPLKKMKESLFEGLKASGSGGN